jgi:hypothetical protein
LDQVRLMISARHYSIRTEQAYVSCDSSFSTASVIRQRWASRR